MYSHSIAWLAFIVALGLIDADFAPFLKFGQPASSPNVAITPSIFCSRSSASLFDVHTRTGVINQHAAEIGRCFKYFACSAHPLQEPALAQARDCYTGIGVEVS